MIPDYSPFEGPDGREVAREYGAKLYRDGTPCRAGHVNPWRYTRTGACRDCIQAIGNDKPEPTPGERDLRAYAIQTVAVEVPFETMAQFDTYRELARAFLAERFPAYEPRDFCRIRSPGKASFILHRDDADLFRSLPV